MLSNYYQLSSLPKSEFLTSQRNYKFIWSAINRQQIGGLVMGIGKAIEFGVQVCSLSTR
jgi:hypothetical protein